MRNTGKVKILTNLLIILGGVAASYRAFLRTWLTTWGATPEEHFMTLAGDELIPGGAQAPLNMTQAITINAPPEKVWPWLVQIGQHRSGFMSFEKLERFLGFGIRNVYRIVPEWQHLEAGDFCFFHQNGIGMRIVDVAENHHIVMLTDSRRREELKPGWIELLPPKGWKWHVAWNWSFNLIALPNGKTRFLARGLADWSPLNPVADFILDFFGCVPSCIMQMQMCKELKTLAEGTHPSLGR